MLQTRLHCCMYISTPNSTAHSELLHWQEVAIKEELHDKSGVLVEHAADVDLSLSASVAHQGTSINVYDINRICVESSVCKVLT